VTKINKILVVRVGRAGDMVMITPALNAVLAATPAAEVHVLTSAEGRRVLNGYNDRVTRTWLYHRRFPGNLRSRRKLVRALRGQDYDRVYVFESDPHYHRLLQGVAPAVYRLEGGAPGIHYCNRCLELVADSTTAPVDRGWVSLPVSESGRTKARALLDKHGIGPDMILVGLHPTYGGSALRGLLDRRGRRHRVWPRDSFVRLARGLRERAEAARIPLRVLIDALPEERKFVEPIVTLSGGSVTLLTEPPDFERYKGLLQCMDVMVTPNTGPMHIVAAVGTRVVALFSGWSVEECGPFVPEEQYRVLRAEDYEHGEHGLEAIPPEKVVEAVLELVPAGHGA
jgi:heptosyltransferase-1